MKLINNQETRLFDELIPLLNENVEVLISASYISINALYELANEFKKVNSIRILLDNDGFEHSFFNYDPQEWAEYYDLKARYKAEIAFFIVKNKCKIRRANLGGQKIILIKNGDKSKCFSIVPRDLNNITLGLTQSPDPIIISSFDDAENQYLNLFDQFWNNSNRDIKTNVEDLIRKACITNSPDYLYKYSLYNIFQNSTIDEASEQRLKSIGFKNTAIWKMLYNFQQDAVLGAIDKIETFGGCIIADSVGLGKTFEALAIMKYYQMRNDRILVLCPKKLRDNWIVYAQNDVRNILTRDRFNFDVLNHTDLSRTYGTSGYINLETINWGNYDLVVIDESHNFRNNPPRKETITRYQRLMNDNIKTGVKTKVLMLS
jgi:SNF2 family DNA or RNA helicase